jgi:hypothetical protein
MGKRKNGKERELFPVRVQAIDEGTIRFYRRMNAGGPVFFINADVQFAVHHGVSSGKTTGIILSLYGPVRIQHETVCRVFNAGIGTGHPARVRTGTGTGIRAFI